MAHRLGMALQRGDPDEQPTTDLDVPGHRCRSPAGNQQQRLCPEDTNGDGVVNVLDLIELLLCFGLPANAPSEGCGLVHPARHTHSLGTLT